MKWEKYVRRREKEIDEILSPFKEPEPDPTECASFLAKIASNVLSMATSFKRHLKFADGVNLYWIAVDRRGVKQYLKNFAKAVGLPQLELYKLAKLLSMATRACKFNTKLSKQLEQLSKQAMEDYMEIRLKFTPQILQETLTTMDITKMVNVMEEINETLQQWAKNIQQLTTWTLEEIEKTEKTRELIRKLTS